MTSPFRIRLSCPVHTPEIEDAVLSVLRSGWLIAGKKNDEFEASLRRLTGRRHVIAVSSGTGALLCAMVAMGIGPDSTVVVPAFTFPAPASAAAFLGARIRLCDVDEGTFNISADKLLSVLDDTVSLVVGIDQFGNPCPAPELAQICTARGIPLLIDAACSIGASLNGHPCGSFGDAAIFSFHPRKIVTTAEGGAVLTDDDDIAATVKRFRNIGMENGLFTCAGLNLRPSELGAAMGIEQLNVLDAMIEKRRALAKAYLPLPFVMQQSIDGALTNYQSLVAVIPDGDKSGRDRRADKRADFVQFMAARGIQTQVGSYHLARIDWLKQQEALLPENTPCSDRLHDLAVTLPMHDGLCIGDVDEIVAACELWMRKNGGKA